MAKNVKKAITISLVIVIIIIVIISTFFIVKHLKGKSIINNIEEMYANAIIQDTLANETTNEEDSEKTNIFDDLTLEIDGEKVVGVLTIEKINFHDLVYEGTATATLDKGVCHMENSSFLQGNVCLAGHNTNQIFGKLHMLENGDKITYTSFLGTKEYKVISIAEIHESDWSLLQDTEENKLTLITCIKNKPFKRLCIQAIETL